MELNIVIWLLFAHWVADFLMQTDEMAQNKSKNNMWLLKHCLAYGCGITLVSIIGIAIICLVKVTPMQMFVYGLLVTAIHFPVDYVTSRINSKLWADKKVHWFFVSVGFDQWIHFVTLLLLWPLIVK